MNPKCKYGCGQEGRFQLKNGKWCCSEYHSQCPVTRKEISKTRKGRKTSEKVKGKMRNARKNSTASKNPSNQLCKHGCGQVGVYLMGRGSSFGWCCSKYHSQCPVHRKRASDHKHSDETLKTMSESGKKKVFTDKHRANISKANKGRKQSDEHIRKRMIAHLGHTRICDDKNPNWQGGISNDPYCTIWKRKEFKEYFKERDSNKCQNPICCGNSNHLPLHRIHIDNDKQNCHPDNIILGCNSCNGRMQKKDYREWWTSWYQAIMHQQGKLLQKTA